MQPDLSIVFVNYNSTRYLERALESLRRNPPESSVELLVVDNASRDRDELARVCSAAGARLIRLRRNVGYGAAANQGFRQAAGRYLVAANTDIEVVSGAVDCLREFVDSTPGAGVVSPQFVYPDGSVQPSARRFPTLRYALAGRRSLLRRLFPSYGPAREFLYVEVGRSQVPVQVDAVIGTFMVLRREALDQVGAFDQRYFFIAEDLDMCRRMHASGWDVYVDPRARVVHCYGAVRRARLAFTEFHRLRALMRFFSSEGSGLTRAALLFCFVCYLSLIEGMLAFGIHENEPSWRSGRLERCRS